MRFNHLLVAPTGLRKALVEKIRREAAHARAGRPARIVAKINSLVDWPIIQELYAASQAGVQIDLIVRGTCCLRPGVPGLSERIRVRLDHRPLPRARARLLLRERRRPEYYLASADWMPRNLDHRVETAFPILDPGSRPQIRQMLDVQLADTVKARLLQPDGTSVRADRMAAGALALTGADLRADRRRSAAEAARPRNGSRPTVIELQHSSARVAPWMRCRRFFASSSSTPSSCLVFLGRSRPSCASAGGDTPRHHARISRARTPG